MQHIVADAGNRGAELLHEADGSCAVCFEPKLVRGESPRVCGSCEALVCIDCFLKCVFALVIMLCYVVLL
jgi:hypothetical protein